MKTIMYRKLNISQKKNSKICFRTLRIFFFSQMDRFFLFLNDYISENKNCQNRKIYFQDLFQLRICQPPPSAPPFRISPIFMIDAHSAESNEKSIFRFLFLSYGWLYLQFAGNTPGFSIASPIKDKNSFKTGQIYRNDVQWA